MIVLTALIGDSPSPCPLEEKEKLASHARNRHLALTVPGTGDINIKETWSLPWETRILGDK